MKTRIIYTDFWDDGFVELLDQKTTLLFNYLFTNHKIGLTGMYPLSDFTMQIRAKFKTMADLKRSQKILEDGKKVFFYDGWVYVKNAERLGGYKGEKNEKAKLRELELIPDNIKAYFKEVSNRTKEIDRVLEKEDTVSGVSNTPINHKSEIINHKSEIQEDSNNIVISTVEDKAKLVIGKFNIAYGKTLKAYEPILKNLEYWLETYTLEDIYKAIENAANSKFWRKIIDSPVVLLRQKNPEGEKVDYIGRMKDLEPDQEGEPFMIATDGRKFWTKEEVNQALNDGSYGHRKDDETGKTIIFKMFKK